MSVRSTRNQMLAEQMMGSLASRNMEAYYVKNKEEALAKALSLLPEGSTVSWGGTASAAEIGLLETLKNGNYTVYDRADADSDEGVRGVILQAFDCDFYIGSVNAMSVDGVLVNIDGHSNRVAAYAWGPRNLLLIVGMNKVAKTVEDAISRARNEASPINAQRFGINPPCVKAGSCFDCKAVDCICCNVLITRFSQKKNRIKIILVDESLGF